MGNVKIYKFFSEYGFKLHGNTETYTGHIAHSKNDYFENHQHVTFLRENSEYVFISPVRSKTYRLTDAETRQTLNNGSILVLGFTQQQFIQNVKEYFDLI